MRGNEISSRKKVVLCFEILGQTKEYRVFVIDGLHEDFILGIDYEIRIWDIAQNTENSSGKEVVPRNILGT